MGYGKKRELSFNIFDYNLALMGTAKSGKTTLLKEACAKTAGEDGYLFVETGQERGADAIAGINYINTPTWWMDYDEIDNAVGFGDLIDDICTNKTSEYPDLKVVIIDTLDWIIPMAEDEAVRLWNRELKKEGKPQCTSVLSAYGGFNRGVKKAESLILDSVERLRKVGVTCWWICHVKNRDVTDIITGDTYTTLTSSCQQSYFNAVKQSLHWLGLLYVDRDIVVEQKKTNKGVDKQKKNYRVTSESRKIRFRSDDNAIDSGSRFANIEEEIPLDVDLFIETLENSIKAEASKSGTSLAEQKKTQAKAKAKKAEKIAEQEVEAKAENELEDMIEQITAFIKTNKADMSVVKPIMSALKAIDCKKPSDISSVEDAMTILALCE